MQFSQVQFYKSVGLGVSELILEPRSEIIFVGRSNVGKSSVLNALFEKKDYVKTSSKPGKTRLANMFLVANKYYFTDLPGYGFAKLGKNLKQELDGLISWYVEEKANAIKKVYILIDSKLGAQQVDIDMYHYILDLGLPVCIILSKIDRLGKSDQAKAIAHTKEQFFGQDIIPISSTKKMGIESLKKDIKKSFIN